MFFIIYLGELHGCIRIMTSFSMLQADPNADVRGRMINAGVMVIDKHGRENVGLLFPIFENYLNEKVDHANS